jgi:hypothetical protein
MLLDRVIVAYLVKKSPDFMELQVPKYSSQEFSFVRLINPYRHALFSSDPH